MTDERFLLLAMLMMIAFFMGRSVGEREGRAHELAGADRQVALRGALGP